MATIGSINVAITATTEKLQKGLKAAQSLIGGFGGKLTEIGAVVAETAFGAMVEKFAHAGAELAELSIATGIAVNQLSFLKYAAEQTGKGLDVFTIAIRTMAQKGIAASRFEEIAEKIAAIKDPLGRMQSAMYYFGRKGALAILPLVNELPELRERFEKLGGSFTEKMAKNALRLHQSWGDIKLAIANVAYEIGDILSPIVISASEYIAAHGAAIKQWVADHSTLITVLAATTTTLSVLIPAIHAFIAAMKICSLAIGAFRLALVLLDANPIVLAVTAITTPIILLVYWLEKAYGLWTKFKKLIGAGDEGNYISRRLTPRNSGSQAAPVVANSVAHSADNSVAEHTAQMNDTLAQILSQMKLSNVPRDRNPIAEPQVAVAGMR